MRRVTLSVLGMMLLWGCARAPSTPWVMVPPPDHGQTPPADELNSRRPMPRDASATRVPPPPFEDAPIVSQAMPEQTAFVDIYNRVGRPRIAVIADPAIAQGDDASTNEAVRSGLSDWLACNGRVAVVAAANAKEADENADVVVQIHALVNSSREDPHLRLLAEASNTKDRISIGRAVADVPMPLEKPRIDNGTRQIARKLMDEMTTTWQQPEPATGRQTNGPPPTTEPVR